jgi:hypothetical protein
MYVAANGFYLADGRGGRSFFVVLSYQAAYREQSRGWFGTTAIIAAVGGIGDIGDTGSGRANYYE